VLAPSLLGRRLAEDVLSDVDSPPHDKSAMDGYAVTLADLASGRAVLTILEEIPAGRVPQHALRPGCCSRIMTGAPIPQGTEAVSPVEKTNLLDPTSVEITDSPRLRQNILFRGSEMRQGQCIFPAGTLLRAVELGVLATAGRASLRVVPAPLVAVLSTGDELVEPAEVPGPGKIRNSNGLMLHSLAETAGSRTRYLGIARDSSGSLGPLIREGLRANVLILSGGVSMGALDLVPGLLQEEGIVPHLHKVAMKPGKPVFFGTRDANSGADSGPTLVFGLPGNPVSSLVCFELFVRPALRKLSGHPDPRPSRVMATLTEDFAYRTDRPTYHPAVLREVEAGWSVLVIPWGGAADLLGLARANSLVVLPPGDHVHRAGSVFPVLRLDGPA
jgi:molybdopterin molybdotransferase